MSRPIIEHLSDAQLIMAAQSFDRCIEDIISIRERYIATVVGITADMTEVGHARLGTSPDGLESAFNESYFDIEATLNDARTTIVKLRLLREQ